MCSYVKLVWNDCKSETGVGPMTFQLDAPSTQLCVYKTSLTWLLTRPNRSPDARYSKGTIFFHTHIISTPMKNVRLELLANRTEFQKKYIKKNTFYFVEFWKEGICCSIAFIWMITRVVDETETTLTRSTLQSKINSSKRKYPSIAQFRYIKIQS